MIAASSDVKADALLSDAERVMTTIESDNGAGSVNLVKIAPICLTTRDSGQNQVSGGGADSVPQPPGKKVVLSRKNVTDQKFVTLPVTKAENFMANMANMTKQKNVRGKRKNRTGDDISGETVKKRREKKSQPLARRAPAIIVSGGQPTLGKSSGTERKAAAYKDDIVHSSLQGVCITLTEKDSGSSGRKGVQQFTKSAKSVFLLGKMIRHDENLNAKINLN
jgi:hypothetical protein